MSVNYEYEFKYSPPTWTREERINKHVAVKHLPEKGTRAHKLYKLCLCEANLDADDDLFFFKRDHAVFSVAKLLKEEIYDSESAVNEDAHEDLDSLMQITVRGNEFVSRLFTAVERRDDVFIVDVCRPWNTGTSFDDGYEPYKDELIDYFSSETGRQWD